jgi:hypothetical protein
VNEWGFGATLGTGGAGGDFSSILTEPISGEYDFFKQKGAWRFGVGLSFGSFNMKQPYQNEEEWGFQQTYLSATRFFRTEAAVRPYLRARFGLARLHPRSEVFAFSPPPEEPGDSPTKPANGFSVGVIPGLEFRLSRAAFVDASFSWTYFTVDEYDLSPVRLPNASSGSSWEARLGLNWFPNGGQPTGSRRAGPKDAWGVQKSWGWAAGETLAINLVSSGVNEYMRNANFNQISPRSWAYNFDYGFTFDDNEFKTNQYVHPFNGAAYYNSGRANGLNFWSSTATAVGGALFWECCGETHPMSFNDMVSTGIGGIALGEAQYRLSSQILNNQSGGAGRFFREFGGLLVDPIRGVNRLVSGRWFRKEDNPTDSMDWRPPGGVTFVAVGARVMGQGESLSEDTKTQSTILLNHTYGDVFDNERRGPFDYMDFVAELNTPQKEVPPSEDDRNGLDAKGRLSNVQIRGNLKTWALGQASKPNHVLALVQYFDYMNNQAYEFGGQSFGLSLFSRFKLGDKVGLKTRVDGSAMVLGGVNSDYSWLADVAHQERIREYDYGPGLGTLVSATLSVSGKPILYALYRFQWISVSNGSVYNEGNFGSDADHYIQGGGIRLNIPLKGGFGLGGDVTLFQRDSHYSLVNPQAGIDRRRDVNQRNPQARAYLSYTSVRGAR